MQRREVLLPPLFFIFEKKKVSQYFMALFINQIFTVSLCGSPDTRAGA